MDDRYFIVNMVLWLINSWYLDGMEWQARNNEFRWETVSDIKEIKARKSELDIASVIRSLEEGQNISDIEWVRCYHFIIHTWQFGFDNALSL